MPKGISGVVNIPEGVKFIPAGTFDWKKGITAINLPETLIAIRSTALKGMNITRIRIPSSVEIIAEDAFVECEKLIYVENESDCIVAEPFSAMFPYAAIVKNKGGVSSGSQYIFAEGSAEGWDYHLYGDYIYGIYALPDEYDDVKYKCRIFAYLGEDKVITLPTEIDGVEAVPYRFVSAAETIIVPEGTVRLIDGAFARNPNVKHVILPESLYEIGGQAFYRCYSLEELELPANVLDIGAEMCTGCEALKKVTFPEGLTYIPDTAFGGCYSLSEVDFPSTLIRIEAGAFSQVSFGGTLELPPYLKYVGNYSFYGVNITKLIVNENIEEIGTGAFLSSTLAEIVLPDKPFIIRPNAFFDYWFGYCFGAFAANEDNWDGDFLYCGNHLLSYRGNDVYVKVERDVASIAEDAFANCSRMRFLEITGTARGALTPKYTPSLEMLIIRHEPKEQINRFFMNGDDKTDVPSSLKYVVIKDTCCVEHRDEFENINGVSIFVENTKADAPFDRIAPGWNNENIVMYGDKWYMASFFDAEGKIITMECFRNTQPIRPPYVVLPKSGDTAYTHIGWDTDGDGEPDGLPASRLSDVVAYAVVRTSKPAYYTVKFMDIDRKTVLSETVCEYGAVIAAPAELPTHRGYTFTGWENYAEGDTVSESVKIYSTWKHDGDGHDYEQTVIAPTCTDRGYTLHKCSICGDEYRTDYVKENWHTFGKWITDKEPTCSEAGQRHRICDICGFEENAVIETTGHDYVSTVIKEATCTERGVMEHVCSVCGDTAQEVIPLEPHDYQPVYAGKDYIEWLDHEFSGIVWGAEGETYWYYTCSHCGKIQTSRDIAAASSAGSNHKHELCAILNANGEAVAVRCSLCGYVFCHEHQYVEIGEDGEYIVYECTNCGHEYKEKKPEPILYGDATGDGIINGRDVIRLRKYLSSYDPDTGTSGAEISAGADVNGDGVVNGRDLIRLRKYLSENEANSGESPEILGSDAIPDVIAIPADFKKRSV